MTANDENSTFKISHNHKTASTNTCVHSEMMSNNNNNVQSGTTVASIVGQSAHQPQAYAYCGD